MGFNRCLCAVRAENPGDRMELALPVYKQKEEEGAQLPGASVRECSRQRSHLPGFLQLGMKKNQSSTETGHSHAMCMTLEFLFVFLFVFWMIIF